MRTPMPRQRVLPPFLFARRFAAPRRALPPLLDGARRRFRARMVREPRRAHAAASGRGPLRGDRARDGDERRLGDAAARRPQVFREAATAILADGGELRGVRSSTNGPRVCPARSPDSSRWPWSRMPAACSHRPRPALYAAVALAGSLWQFGISHLVTLDALLTFWLTLTLCAFLLAQHARARSGAFRGAGCCSRTRRRRAAC